MSASRLLSHAFFSQKIHGNVSDSRTNEARLTEQCSSSTLIEPFTESLLIGLIGGLSFRHFTSFPASLFFVLHMIAWYMVDISVFKSLAAASPISQPRKLDYEKPSWQFFQAWFLRECSALPSECATYSGDMS